MEKLGFNNARFEVNSEEGLDVVEEFYTSENPEVEQAQPELQVKTKSKINQGDSFVQDIQQDLQKSVRAVN